MSKEIKMFNFGCKVNPIGSTTETLSFPADAFKSSDLIVEMYPSEDKEKIRPLRMDEATKLAWSFDFVGIL